MLPVRPLVPLLAVSVLLALTACGGGGGGGAGDGGTAAAPTALVLNLNSRQVHAVHDSMSKAVLQPGEVLFRRIDGGSITAGSAAQALGAQPNETQHTARVGTFYLMAYELTQREWELIAGTTPWTSIAPASERTISVGAERPAFGLSRLVVANAMTSYNAGGGPDLRLPTGDEWEYACRAGTTTRFWWGDADNAATVARYATVRESQSGVPGLRPVGARLANPFGLYDMLGNAWEWVDEPATGQNGVLRGGSWSDNLVSARSANRQHLDPDVPYALAGVRLVLRQ